ncbi:MAG: inositol monophosphatase [Candidatus Saccharibacteria bacterium]|nr:inositol monophosphatase [Candidatus Saccharibacteria bacterium]
MEAEFIKSIIKETEKISRKNYEVRQKDKNGDLVTTLDIEIEQYLIKQIKQKYPNFDIVSEEFNSNKKTTENCFIIDPIDGTINFANNIPLWGTQIACKKDGETIASAINLPKINEFYYADKTGAYLNGEKISIREVSIKNVVYSIIGKNSLPSIERMRKSYSKNHRNFGAACVAFAFMASGRIHGVNFRVENPWDYEPGMFICKMAGAKVKSKEGFHAVAMNQEFLNILEKETAFPESSQNML